MRNVNLPESWDDATCRKMLHEKGKTENYIDAYVIGFKEGFKEWFKEGVNLGKEEIIENLLKTGNYTISELACLTDVSQTFVSRVENAMQ